MEKKSQPFLCIALLALGIATIGPLMEAEQANATVDPALRQAVEARRSAPLAKDFDTYARLTWDDAVIVVPNGTVQTTQARMTALKAGLAGRPKISDEQYRMFGDTAIYTFSQDIVIAQGQTNSLRALQTWVKHNGEWKLAAGSNTRIQR